MPNKSLGQHWLQDRKILSAIADEAAIDVMDTVLEIGPGQGALTSILLSRAEKVVAVEFDSELAKKIPGQFPGKNLEVVNNDILQFDLSNLPNGYKVVANVPYYITNKIVQKLMTADNKPSVAVLLVQKEVAERIAAKQGDMSILAISAQAYADVSLGIEVPAEFFTPPPKVDSQVVILKTRDQPLIPRELEKEFFRVVKAGFSEKRKKLRSSLSGGLGTDKKQTESMFSTLGIDLDLRAQDLDIEQWVEITKARK